MERKKNTILLFVSILIPIIYGCERSSPFISRKDAGQKIEEILNQIEMPEISGDTINLIEFSGYAPDESGSVDFHPYIIQAIETLSKKGGGWLMFPNTEGVGSWLRYTETYRIVGPIDLKSNTGLLIDRSVRLFFPFNPEKYNNNGKGVITRYEGTTIYSFSPLIRAFNQENIIIKSRGTSGAMPVIDGDGEKWQRWMWDGETARREKGLTASYQLLKNWNNEDVPIKERVYTDPSKDYFRPEAIEFFLCKKILLDGIKLVNSPFWCIKPVFSQSCIFRNLAFDAMNVNNDGIDPESSKNILIENIMFGNHDDNIAIKAGRDKEGRDGALVTGTELENIDSEYIKNHRITGATENVVIRNCHFYGHHAICIGSEMSGRVRDIYAIGNYSVKEVNMGVFIKSSRLRGGTVENVYVNGLHLNHCKNEVIALVPNYDKADESPFPPTFKNIQIENVRCNSSKKGILIHGWFDAPVTNIQLKNLQLEGVAEEELEIEQVQNVFLENVKINQKKYNETINKLKKEDKPPEKI